MSFTIISYITSWCPDCTRSRRILTRSGLPFREIDIEKVEGAEEEMRRLNGGSGKIPTILIESEAGRHVLIEPADRELAEHLRVLQRALAS